MNNNTDVNKKIATGNDEEDEYLKFVAETIGLKERERLFTLEEAIDIMNKINEHDLLGWRNAVINEDYDDTDGTSMRFLEGAVTGIKFFFEDNKKIAIFFKELIHLILKLTGNK